MRLISWNLGGAPGDPQAQVDHLMARKPDVVVLTGVLPDVCDVLLREMEAGGLEHARVGPESDGTCCLVAANASMGTLEGVADLAVVIAHDVRWELNVFAHATPDQDATLHEGVEEHSHAVHLPRRILCGSLRTSGDVKHLQQMFRENRLRDVMVAAMGPIAMQQARDKLESIKPQRDHVVATEDAVIMGAKFRDDWVAEGLSVYAANEVDFYFTLGTIDGGQGQRFEGQLM